MSVIPFVQTAYAVVDDQALGRVLGPIITHIVNPIIELMFAIAVVVFVYGVFQLVWNKADGDAHTRGKNSIWGGLIGMFIMLSAWGIINLISNTVKSF
jgi:zinc transporter ZupT